MLRRQGGKLPQSYLVFQRAKKCVFAGPVRHEFLRRLSRRLADEALQIYKASAALASDVVSLIASVVGRHA
jgi:hypothetical protein